MPIITTVVVNMIDNNVLDLFDQELLTVIKKFEAVSGQAISKQLQLFAGRWLFCFYFTQRYIAVIDTSFFQFLLYHMNAAVANHVFDVKMHGIKVLL